MCKPGAYKLTAKNGAAPRAGGPWPKVLWGVLPSSAFKGRSRLRWPSPEDRCAVKRERSIENQFSIYVGLDLGDSVPSSLCPGFER